MKYLTLLYLICLAASVPVPPTPKVVTKAQSPRAASEPVNTPMAKVSTPQLVIVQGMKTNILAATYPATKIANLTVFCQVCTNLPSNVWTTIATLPYYTNGGTFAVPYTNTQSYFFFRFGTKFNP